MGGEARRCGAYLPRDLSYSSMGLFHRDPPLSLSESSYFWWSCIARCGGMFMRRERNVSRDTSLLLVAVGVLPEPSSELITIFSWPGLC
eukprot:gene5701-4064_t